MTAPPVTGAGGEAASDPVGPVRTCIGCRSRAPVADLVRFVADPVTGHPVLDPTRTAPGRGAHLHDADACFDLALRRRAFPRALRSAAIDPEELRGRWDARLRPGGSD